MPLDSHPLGDLWESSPRSTKGVRVYKYIVNGILASLSPGKPAEMSSALSHFLLSTQRERGVGRDER